jgi:hypothetical protein
MPGIIIDGSKMQDAGDGLPKHCILSGEVSDRTGVDGKRPLLGNLHRRRHLLLALINES